MHFIIETHLVRNIILYYSLHIIQRYCCIFPMHTLLPKCNNIDIFSKSITHAYTQNKGEKSEATIIFPIPLLLKLLTFHHVRVMIINFKYLSISSHCLRYYNNKHYHKTELWWAEGYVHTDKPYYLLVTWLLLHTYIGKLHPCSSLVSWWTCNNKKTLHKKTF